MGDKPHKNGPEALAEIGSLPLDTRRHLHGLIERHTEGVIVLAGLVVILPTLVSALPDAIGKNSGVVLLGWVVFVFFSVGWCVRSVFEIRRSIIQTFSSEELREGQTYSRYCEGAVPMERLKVRVKWLWSQKPAASAISTIGLAEVASS